MGLWRERRMDWRREVEGVGSWAVGGAAVGIVGHVWRPNVASMVGRSAAPRGSRGSRREDLIV